VLAPFLQGPKLADTAEINAALEMLGTGDGTTFGWSGSSLYTGTMELSVSIRYFFPIDGKYLLV
jgi:hypothetical protein